MANSNHTPTDLFELLCWDLNSPAEEWRQGFDYGGVVARSEISDRAELLSLVAAMDRGRLDFLEEISRTSFIASGPAANAPLAFIEELLFGVFGGGFHGEFGRAFCAAFRLEYYLGSGGVMRGYQCPIWKKFHQTLQKVEAATGRLH